MNNYQWLLQMDGADRKAWFDAEHVETEERALDGGTEPENEDSRDKLEADIRQYANPEGNTGTLGACWERKMLEFIDRQAAITEREYGERMASEAMCSNVCAVVCEQRGRIAELQAQVDTLKAERVKLRSQICKLEDDLVRTSDERDNWKANCEDWKKHARAAENACYETMLEREDYRKKFGKCLDYADAIHALMDDEGLA